jgi:hypothetical protein
VLLVLASRRGSDHDVAMNKSSNLLLNFASELDGQPMNFGPLTPFDVVALRAALAAVALTVVLVLSLGFAGV